jgi:TPR repeat protein
MRFRNVAIVLGLFVLGLFVQPLFASNLVGALLVRAENGDDEAMLSLGIAYELGGYGVSQNMDEAIKWYRKSANLGNANGQAFLGTCYLEGKGVAKDYVEAVKWYTKSADQGQNIGLYSLGICYQFGFGVSKDMGKAVKLFATSALNGDALAQVKMGSLFLGLNKPDEAVKWYKMAAKQGNEEAKRVLKQISER